MRNYLKIIGAAVILSITPLLWSKELTFNLAVFTTEYYKFLSNIFVVGLIALFFKSQTEAISKQSEKNKKKKVLEKAIENLKEQTELPKIKSDWLTIYAEKNSLDSTSLINIEKHNRFIENLNHLNFDVQKNSSDFTEFRKYIIEIKIL